MNLKKESISRKSVAKFSFNTNNLPSEGSVRDAKLRRKHASRIEYHTKIFASMCPDEILDYYDDYETRSYHTTLMLGDVSGFTELTEKYTKSGKGGPSQLSEILNNYIGTMVQEILSHNGDVLKFSGDAFIVMWKLEGDGDMSDVALEAIHTACVLQKYFGTLETDVGITLKVKLAIASGKVYFTSIGDPAIASHYIITGKPVSDVKLAETLCKGGDILVTRSSWQWANPNDFVYEVLPDGKHTLILSSSIMWERAKDRYHVGDEHESEAWKVRHSTVVLFPNGISTAADQDSASLIHNLPGDTWDSNFREVDYSLRPKVTSVAKRHLKHELRSYMLRPVIRSVEADEPLEYLAEMRQVVILFVNVITENVGKKKLIALVNAAYKLVCGIVGNAQGCVNKTSLFDKDLMFLCIFGLRGDKHELESQIGLRCATKVREALSSMKHVNSVSVGVTTGIAYCGVVGHILRREYTVIGTSVNKAARLMCAYTNKVVCDRESFLHSRLEARHFVLQEPKYLKGLSQVGPVYEFLEQTTSVESEITVSSRPLLGRDLELDIFDRMLIDKMTVWKRKSIKPQEVDSLQNVLIFRGEPRMGKTRLLDELAIRTPANVYTNYISLLPSDSKVPYSLVRFIFSEPLGFASTSTPAEREKTLVSYLGKIRQPQYLCTFNELFNVEFPITARYRTLRELDKQQLLRQLLDKLTTACFKSIWVILIDDAEYCDEESMILFPTIVKQKTVLFVLAYGTKFQHESTVQPIIRKKALIVDLMGIDKWYHSGLACQILDVAAIPAELEKVIQEKSMGNPGWIESFLVSLLQAGSLILKTIPISDLAKTELVVPSIAMLDRSASVRQKLHSFEPDDGWKMYEHSYRGSNSSMEEGIKYSFINPTLSKVIEDELMITVCTIQPEFPIEDVDGQITLDGMILKLFDSLTPLDQVLLKCAAVLGETIDRKMLESLMEETPARDIAVAVTKLFDIRILGCAMGDFNRSPGPRIFFRTVRNPYVDIEVRCGCTGLMVPEDLLDLPKYANCGLLRFKMALFQKTTYTLLTGNQKVGLHSKALAYLQKKTRRCVSCGEGPFTRLLGIINVEESRTQSQLRDVMNFQDILAFGTTTDYLDTFTRAGSVSPALVSSSEEEDKVSGMNWIKRIWHPLERVSTRSFTQVDFSNCQCNLILINAYTNLLAHCKGIGRNDKTLTAILEFVELCLLTCNIPQAIKLLDDGEVILDQLFRSSVDELVTLPLLRSKIHTLRGRCYIHSGLVVDAERSLLQATRFLGYHFPTSKIAVRLKASFMLKKQKLMLSYLRNCTVSDEDAANYNDQLSKCLTELYTVFQVKGMREHSHLAAIWSLNAALSSSKDFFTLCKAYANMIVMANCSRHKSLIPRLENDAILICSYKKDELELTELQAVAFMYSGIFFSRWLRGLTKQATGIGFVSNRLANTTNSVALKLNVLPKLSQLLMNQQRYSEVVSLLRELEFISSDDTDNSGKTWYHALCLDVQLEAGLTIIPYRQCEQYYQEEGETMVNLRDPEAEKRYFTAMWLWCVRIQDWESATVWQNRRILSVHIQDDQLVPAAVTALKKLEGLLILCVHRLNSKNAKATEETLNDIRSELQIINGFRKIVKIINPRYKLMKAYHEMIKGRTKYGLELLKRCRSSAEEMGNKMIVQWADHCRKVWTNSLSSIQREHWTEMAMKGTMTDWHDFEFKNAVVTPFSLPLPNYV